MGVLVRCYGSIRVILINKILSKMMNSLKKKKRF